VKREGEISSQPLRSEGGSCETPRSGESHFSSSEKGICPGCLEIAEHLLGPNLTFNKDETEARKAEARETVSPVYFQVKRGETILRSGDRVREDHLAKINALRKTQEKSNALSILMGLILLISVALVSLYEFSSKNIRKFSLSQKDLLLLSTTMLGTMALLRLFQ
jgi:membrane-associated HD superfamily phosphohydrolase